MKTLDLIDNAREDLMPMMRRAHELAERDFADGRSTPGKRTGAEIIIACRVENYDVRLHTRLAATVYNATIESLALDE